ncbi:MAG: cytochrome c class [Myxococcales bacterium]|nr:cytochrome c class [Myxococcales bacterium]
MVRVLIVFVLAVGCGNPASGSADGPTVFRQICSSCHGDAGKPPEAMVARLAVRDLTAKEFRDRATPALVEAQVRNGSKNKLMPAFVGALTDDQIKAVSAYVASPTFPQSR